VQPDTTAEIVRLDERLRGLDRLLDEREKALRAAFAASEKAIEKAEGAQLRVNAAQNEFRGALSDMTKNFITRVEFDSLDKRVQAVERSNAGMIGKIGGALGVISLLLVVAELAMRLMGK
jgi:hypothetical protein